MKDKLTPKQQAFADYYIECGNATEAAKRAGYLEKEVVADIARRIQKTLTYTRTAELQAMAMRELGYSPAKIRKEAMKILNADSEFRKIVAKNTLEYKRDVKNIINSITKEAYKANDEIVASAGNMSWINDLSVWKDAGKELTDNSFRHQLAGSFAAQTAGELKNMTRTTGFKTMSGYEFIENVYKRELDKAVIKVCSGTFDQNKVVRDVVHDLAQSGLRSIDFANGYTQGFTTGVQKMSASLGKLAAAVGIAFSVTALVRMGQQAIDLASDIQEVDNVVSKSFGHMRGEMDALANTAIEKLGMSRLTAYKTGSTFMSMGKSMLTSVEDAKDMALALTELTGNMSSFYNVTQDVASTALKSIYTGETETLKQFGVVMTEANLQQFAYEQGIKKTISAMTQSEKVMLRYKYVAEQLSFIGSDFADTQNSWANQTRILSEQWKELLSVLGSGLITVLTPVVKGLNGILSSLISIANAAGKIISDVFGIITINLHSEP